MEHSRDPDIICFKHCGSDIFVFSVPNRCPVCNESLEQCSSEFLPFVLPSPFISATESPCSVILRSSRGDLLRDFHNDTNLHIALTDSHGSIVEFDSPGLIYTASKNVNKTVWRQCLLIAKVPESWFSEWDRQIRHVARDQGWEQKKYDAQALNCFSFVLDFLRFLGYDSLTTNDSSEFCARFVLPKLTYAAKYITIFRIIEEHGLWRSIQTINSYDTKSEC